MRGTQTVEILRAALVGDGYGNTLPDWSAPSVNVVGGCSLQPVQGDEQTVGRDVIVTRWRLRAQLGTDLRASDRVRYREVVYDVDGEVQVWEGLHGYVSALLRKGA